MNNEELFARIGQIKRSNPQNLMARYFDKDYFLSLSNEKQKRVKKIIASGIENPESLIGAYAMQPSDYKEFGKIFKPIIRHYHNIDNDREIKHFSDWDIFGENYNLETIDKSLTNISMRVRVARNLSAFPLAGALSKEQRIELENIAIKAFEKLAKEQNFGGKYLSLTPNSPYKMSDDKYQELINKHQIFKNMSKDKYLSSAGISSDWPFGRGIYISKNEDFLVWVGEEDYLRIMAMQIGSDLTKLFMRLYDGLQKLSRFLPAFAFDKSYGNISSCPTNLGASMRASLHIKLPKLTNNGKNVEGLKNVAQKYGLAVRGVLGEHSSAGNDGLVDISPSSRLGVSEAQIMKNLYLGIEKLWALEQSK